jgi:hypothetical protein
MVDGKPDQCLRASFDAGIFSLIQHGNSSTDNGRYNLDFLLTFMNEVDLPCVDEAWGLVINYLFELIVATTDASYQVATELLRFTSASTYDLQQVNSKDADIRRAQHEGAQWYLLGILNNDMLRTKTVEFAGFQERVRFFWNKAATWVGDERCPGWVEERQQFGLPLRWNPLENEYQSFGPMVIGSKNDIGIPNVVTSILASYRGYDTFGETVVVFTAGIAVLALLKNTTTSKKKNELKKKVGKNV